MKPLGTIYISVDGRLSFIVYPGRRINRGRTCVRTYEPGAPLAILQQEFTFCGEAVASQIVANLRAKRDILTGFA